MLMKIGTTTCLMLLFDFVKSSTYRVVTQQTETELTCDTSISKYMFKKCPIGNLRACGSDIIYKQFNSEQNQQGLNLEEKCPSRRSYICPSSEFSPICLRCAICAAVVEKFNETFVKAHRIIHYRKELKDVKYTLRSTCDFSFEGYEFRNLNNFHVLTSLATGTKHIPSYLDGQWKQRLSKVCHEYLDICGEYHIYQTWLANEESLLDLICRSGGLLRDCSNVPVEKFSFLYPAPKWALTPFSYLEMHKLIACP